MSKELESFFKRVKSSSQSFLLFRMYYNPSSILGDKQSTDELEQEYFELPNLCDLILNNQLLIFLELALKDENFINKLNLYLCRKLHFLLYDSIEFKKYHRFQSDEDLMRLLKGEVLVFDYLDKKGLSKTNDTILGLTSIYETYKKYKRLFDFNYPQEQVDSYDEQKSHNIISSLNFKIKCIQEKIEKDKEQKEILAMIENDDYSNENKDAFLFNRSIGFSRLDNYRLFDATVCNNEFLNIMNKLLLEGQINGKALENAIEIIDASIGIKLLAFPKAASFKERLDNKSVDEFDVVRALQLKSDLSLLKFGQEDDQSEAKVVYFRNIKPRKVKM